MLISREHECSVVDALLEAARRGASGSVVIGGEPGVGKTSLLRYALEQAGDMATVHIRAAEAERELTYAGLSLLVAHLGAPFDVLPEPQRRALETALRMRPPSPVDRFATYAGLLGLLAATAEHQALLVAIDDAHWLDVSSAQALAFVARRLDHDGVALLLAARGEPDWPVDTATPLEPAGLDRRAAGELVGAAPHVAERLCAATAGNPLALIELSRLLSAAQLGGVEPLPEPLPIGSDAAGAFGARIGALEPRTQRALLYAAADDRPPAAVLERALAEIGLSLADLEPAVRAGLVELDSEAVEFRHPLVRAAAYHQASQSERRAVHAALAAALDDQPERRAWHLAIATVDPDEDVAAQLERAAVEARSRGAPAAAAQAFQSAARLTPDADRRAERLLEAAQLQALAGAPAAAAPLFDGALELAGERQPLRARIQHLRVWSEMMRTAPRANAALLRREAALVDPVDRELATTMRVDVAWLEMLDGRPLVTKAAAQDVFDVACELGGPVASAATWTLGSGHFLAGDFQEGCRLCDIAAEQLQAMLPSRSVPVAVGLYWLWIEDFERAHATFDMLIRTARADGAMIQLPYAHTAMSGAEFDLGRWPSAYAHALQAFDLAQQTEQPWEVSYARSILTRIEGAIGRLDSGREHGRRALEAAEASGGGLIPTAGTALGLLELGAGRYEQAIERLEATGRICVERGVLHPGVLLLGRAARGGLRASRRPRRRPAAARRRGRAGRALRRQARPRRRRAAPRHAGGRSGRG